MGIHFLHCAHGNKHIGTYDAIRDTFIVTTQYVDFHMGQKSLHAVPLTALNSFH
jgi:hypothetical protein